MGGITFTSFVPLHLNRVDRQGVSLVNWIEDWFGGLRKVLWTFSGDWFSKAHFAGHRIWKLAPTVAQAVLD
jgi:hypothetical protein